MVEILMYILLDGHLHELNLSLEKYRKRLRANKINSNVLLAQEQSLAMYTEHESGDGVSVSQ